MSNFLHTYWREHASAWNNELVVRFPPEPNGYLHLGHGKAILANADLVESFGGTLLLRMDDTNPRAEKAEYEHAIIEDVSWLGVEVDPVVRYASDHFPALRDLAWAMLEADEAYVDTMSKEEMSRLRGGFNTPGAPSPDRVRPVAWHKARFAEMLEGAVAEGACVLRAKMDLASPNMVLRDPVLWRVLNEVHPRLPGWTSYPTYDFAHPFCDVRDGVSLSLCSLEFEERKPLYDHVAHCATMHGFGLPGRASPVELEFARLEPDAGITSKRALKAAIDGGEVTGWDDPRLLTLRGLRARGYTPDILKAFVRRLGVHRANSVAPLEWLDEEVRNHVGNAPACLVVPSPVRLVLTGDVPTSMTLPSKDILPFTGNELWVGADDVRAHAESGFFRLAPGNTVRLMGLGGFATVTRVEVSPAGDVTGVHAHFEASGKARATVHALPVSVAVPVAFETIDTWTAGATSACWRTTDAFVAPDALTHAGLIHAPRVGWGWTSGKGVWRKLAGMRVHPTPTLHKELEKSSKTP